MVAEWQTVFLEEAPLEIIDGDSGTNYPNQTEFFGTGHCLFLNAGNVTTNGFRFSDCAFITAEKDALLRKGKLHRNDVVLTTRGTVGNAAYFDGAVPFENIRINSGMVILRALAPALQPRYLYLFVRSELFRAQVSSLRTGSAQPQPPIRDINRIEIPVPQPDEQRAIAHILGTLDDKIELNRRMNETLEAMARAIFKSWFIDFDPVRAKTQGRDPGLPKPIADLFPDRFEGSELGEIPAEWSIASFQEIVSLNKDTVNPMKTPDTKFFHFSIPAYDESQSPKKEYGAAIRSQKFLVPGDAVLLSKLNPEIERVWLVDVKTDECAVCSTEFLVFQAKAPFTRAFLYCLACSVGIRRELEGLVTGTSKSHQRAQPEAIHNIQIIVPPPMILKAFSRIVAPLLDKSQANKRESHAKLFKIASQNLPFRPISVNGKGNIRKCLAQTLSGLRTAVQGICELRNLCGFSSHGSENV